MRETRRYRSPVTPTETAARILRSMQDHAACGIARTLADYTQRPEVCAAVLRLLAQEHAEAVQAQHAREAREETP